MMEPLLRRFTDGAAGRRRLIEQLLRQDVVANDRTIAVAIAKSHTLVALQPGEVFIRQDDAETDVYFILSGKVSVEIQGRHVATRGPGKHVGEMTLIDPAERRCATVLATEATVVARVTEEAFTRMAARHPAMWRRMALELGDRLRQRGALVRPRNPRPEVFIGSCSSSDGLGIARALQSAFAHDPWTTHLWTDGVFGPGKTLIESLVARLDTLDFALLVVTPDDLVDQGAGGTPSPRDNVVFELGLMMGALGRERVFMVQTRCPPDELHLPSDLAGVKAIEVIPGTQATLPARVGPAANEFRAIANRLGSR